MTAGTNSRRPVGQPLDRRARCAAPRRPSARFARAACRHRPARRASRSSPCRSPSAGDRVAGRFATGIGSPGDHRFVDGAAPSARRRRPVLLARPHAQPVARVTRVERHILFFAVVARPGARSTAQAEQRLDRALVRLRARNSSTWPSSTSVTITAAGLEVHGRRDPSLAERRGKEPGTGSRQRCRGTPRRRPARSA